MTLGTFLTAGTRLAQNPVTSSPISKGSDAHLVTPEAVLSLREPRELQISPDGKQVAFRVREPADPKLPRAPRKTNIWIVPTDGSELPRPLIPNLDKATSPHWSPDGNWLAFLSDRGESGVDDPGATIQVYLVRSNGGKAERLTSVPGGVEDFAWSPDNRMIAFVAPDQRTAKEQERQSAGDEPLKLIVTSNIRSCGSQTFRTARLYRSQTRILKSRNLHGLQGVTKSPSWLPKLKSRKTHFCFPWWW